MIFFFNIKLVFGIVYRLKSCYLLVCDIYWKFNVFMFINLVNRFLFLFWVLNFLIIVFNLLFIIIVCIKYLSVFLFGVLFVL